MYVGDRIKGLRKEKKLKLKELAEKSGVQIATLSRIEHKKMTGTLDSHAKIAQALGVDVTELYRELKGKTVTTIAYTDTTYYALLGMLSKSGLTKNDLDIQAAGPAGVWQLFVSKKSVAMASTPDWTVMAMEAGAKVSIIPSDVYFKSMAQAILVSDETIEKNPELVKKLVRATLKGMKDIMASPKEAAKAYVSVLTNYKGHEDSIERMFAFYNQYVYANQKVPGTMDESRLADLQKFYISNGIVAQPAALKDLYTNQFVTGK